MEGMRNHLSILDHGVPTSGLPVDSNETLVEGPSVVFWFSVTEFRKENVLQVPTPPSLLAVGVKGIVIGLDATEATLHIVGRRPWVTGCHDHIGRRFDRVGRGRLVADDGHWGRRGQGQFAQFASPKKCRNYSRRGSQGEGCSRELFRELPLKKNVAGKKLGGKKKLEAIGDKLRHRSPRWIISPTFPQVGRDLLFEVFGSLI
jgi:xanthosine utilization system XapX-like protein